MYNDNNYNKENEEFKSLMVIDSDSQRKRGDENRSSHFNLAKKAGMITLGAILFGGVAAGTFIGVNTFTAAPEAQKTTQAISANAASNNADGGILKTVSSSSGNVKGSMDVSDIVENAMPSVVAITCKSVQEVQDFYSFFGRGTGETREVEGRGSGIIIGKNDKELLIVTNNHVIEHANSLSVSFVDGKTCEAKIKGTDPGEDLAVVAVSLADIPSETSSKIAIAEMGNSNETKVGEQVVAIGNALGYGQSVTTGIVSATNRPIYVEAPAAEEELPEQTYIQTDAAINPGNSGGALLNMSGQLIGINCEKRVVNGVEGMGYAIPVSRVSDIIEDLMSETTRDKVDENDRGVLGISCVDVSDSASNDYNIPEGVYVKEVDKGGAAEKAGVVPGDIITAFEGKKITSRDQLVEKLQYYKAGETVSITVQKAQDGSYTGKDLSVTLDKAQEKADDSNDKPEPETGEGADENNGGVLNPDVFGDLFRGDSYYNGR